MIIRRFIKKTQDILLAPYLHLACLCTYLFSMPRISNRKNPANHFCMHDYFFVIFIIRKPLFMHIVGCAIIATVIYAFFGKRKEAFLLFFDDYFSWLSEFIMYSEFINATYQLITALALCILISFFAYIIVVKKFSFIVILATGAVLFAVQWSYDILASFVPFYLFLLAALLAYCKHVFHLKSAAGPNEFAKPFSLAMWSLPLCILVIALASSFQASDKPIEWKWLDQKIFSVYNYFKVNLDYEVFDYFSLSASSALVIGQASTRGKVTLYWTKRFGTVILK